MSATGVDKGRSAVWEGDLWGWPQPYVSCAAFSAYCSAFSVRRLSKSSTRSCEDPRVRASEPRFRPTSLTEGSSVFAIR